MEDIEKTRERRAEKFGVSNEEEAAMYQLNYESTTKKANTKSNSSLSATELGNRQQG